MENLFWIVYIVSEILVMFGIMGTFLKKRNLILVLVCIEVILIAIQLNIIVSSFQFNDGMASLFILFILMVAAGEVAIGLGFLIIYYRIRGTIKSKDIYLTKG